MRRKQGARADVLRALDLDAPLRERPVRETVGCEYCGADMEFGTGDFGVSMQRCSNVTCRNRKSRRLVQVHR
jgi:hypothetical protein